MSPCAVFSRAVLCVDNFWETNSLGHFQLRSESLGAERYGDLIKTYQSTTYWNLVTNRDVFAGAGFCVDSFWETNSFGAFPITE